MSRFLSAAHLYSLAFEQSILSAILGHYSAGFTLDTYAHITTSMQKQAANAVGSFLSGAVR